MSIKGKNLFKIVRFTKRAGFFSLFGFFFGGGVVGDIIFAYFSKFIKYKITISRFFYVNFVDNCRFGSFYTFF